MEELKGTAAGQAFEHYILMELMAYRGINDLDFEISFWRTNSGLEVDFILGDGEVAIEVKIGRDSRGSDMRGLIAFAEQYQPKRLILVNLSAKKMLKKLDHHITLEILPWQSFLTSLWAGKII